MEDRRSGEEARKDRVELRGNLYMATYDDIFGSGSGGKSYLKIQTEDQKVEAIFLDWQKVDQTFDDRKPKFMVQLEDGGPWKAMRRSEFDESEVNAWFPAKDIQLKLLVDGKEMYHTLSKTAEEAFKDALKKAGGIEEGDTIGIWLVSTAKKPYTWKYMIARQES